MHARTHTHTLSLTHSHSLSLSHTHTHTLTHTHSHTLTHTHTDNKVISKRFSEFVGRKLVLKLGLWNHRAVYSYILPFQSLTNWLIFTKLGINILSSKDTPLPNFPTYGSNAAGRSCELVNRATLSPKMVCGADRILKHILLLTKFVFYRM